MGAPPIAEVVPIRPEKIPAPTGDPEGNLQALIFDSWYDAYQGVIVIVRIVHGTIKKGDKIYLKHSDADYEVLKLSIRSPFIIDVDQLSAGEVGMVVCGIKTVRDIKVGDTIVHSKHRETPNLSGYMEIKPMVFCGIFPVESSEYSSLRDSFEKLALNDSSFTFIPETSQALGFGFRCGFLGLLHMNIVQERLEREFEMNIISTAPSVEYKVLTISGESILVDNPAMLPESHLIETISEPIVEVNIHVPNDFVGNIIKLCTERRGVQKEIRYITTERVQIIYELPLAEMVFDFYDKLKGLSKGYASMDYELCDYRASNLTEVDILLNKEKVDALSIICHREHAKHKGRLLVQKLRKYIGRQQYDIVIQAAVGSTILARESIKAFRKNVLAKCYGGDISRKRKLLEKQKAGKKRMKVVGSVEIPQEAFLAVLKVDED